MAGEGGFCDSSCCEECGCLTYCAEWYQAFGVMVCNSCRYNQKFKLLSKATAKSAFLLTDSDLKNLGYITKANPQHKAWQDMKLYLGLQVAEIARKKHGDADALQAARAERVEARIAGRMAKRKAGADAEEGEEEGGQGKKKTKPLNKAQERVWQRLQQDYAAPASKTAHDQAAATSDDLFAHDPQEPALVDVEDI